MMILMITIGFGFDEFISALIQLKMK